MPCIICKDNFKTPDQLKKHLHYEHYYTFRLPLKCTICDENFNARHKFIDHLILHSSKTPYVCDSCGKKFSNKSARQAHEKQHLPPSIIHACKYCNKKFRHKSSLKSHIVIHSEEKPFKCNHCNKSFRRKVNLDSHIKIHDLCKWKYSCLDCNQIFTRKDSVKKHQKLKHPNSSKNYEEYLKSIS